MGPRGVAASVLTVSMLVVPFAAAQSTDTRTAWNQVGGGPDHAGTAVLPSGVLDVIASYRFIEDDDTMTLGRSMSMVPTPHGVVTVVRRATTTATTVEFDCIIVRITDVRAGQLERGEPFPCTGDHYVVGYDAAHDALLFCLNASMDEPALLALDPRSGAVRWSLTPRDVGVLDIPPPPGQIPPRLWRCQSGAIDDEAGIAIVPFYSQVRNRVAAIALADGSVVWSTAIPHARVIGVGGPGPLPTAASAAEPTYEAGFVAITATLLADGSSVVVGQTVPLVERGAAWLDRNGTVQGGAYASTYFPRVLTPGQTTGADANNPLFRGSDWAAGHGQSGVLMLGNRLVFIDPTAAAGSFTWMTLDTSSDSSTSNVLWPAPRWAGDIALVPLATRLFGVDTRDRSVMWTFPTGGPVIADTLLVPPHDAYALWAVRRGDSAEGEVVRLDARNREIRDVVPIPAPGAAGSNRWTGRFLPLPDDQGLLVFDALGTATLLGTSEAGQRPDVRLSNPYPAPEERIAIAPTARGDVAEFRVFWGDGTEFETIPPSGQATHTYSDPGIRSLRVMAVHSGRTTASTVELVRVGGEAPQELTAIQQAFTPDNQNITFGVLGLALAALGGLAAVVQRRRHHSRLDDELARLRDIKARGFDDAPAAMRGLGEYMARIERELGEGVLNDGQFSVLSIQCNQALQTLRLRLMAPFEGRVSAGFEARFAAALADGVLTPEEASALATSLEREAGLASRERDELSRLVWRLAGGAGAAAGGAAARNL